MSVSPQQIAWQLAFEGSPIILTRGIAASMGGALPIIALTEGANFLASIMSGNINTVFARLFAHFNPIPGATIIKNTITKYPLANQNVAANAIISQPLNVSLRMTCPAQPQPAPTNPTPGLNLPALPSIGGLNLNPQSPSVSGFSGKLMTMLSLQATIAQHCNMGGTFTVLTPSFIYVDALLLELREVSGQSGNSQAQTVWQWDFEKPLVSAQAAQSTQNGLMAQITSGAAIGGVPNWIPPASASPPRIRSR